MLFPPVFHTRQALSVGAAGTALLLIALLAIRAPSFVAARTAVENGTDAQTAAAGPTDAQALMDQVAGGLGRTLQASRPVLLGQRDLSGPTCITQQLQDNRILLQGSPNGGAGLRIMAFHAQSPDAPLALYGWSQQKLRPFLQAERQANATALRNAEQLSVTARRLAAALRPGIRPRRGTVVPPRPGPASWPAQCQAELHEALVAEDTDGARRWAEELAAATFALADLHRWLDVLLGAHLASLDFQARCREAFTWSQQAHGRPRPVQQAGLPAAHMTVAWGQNYLEVEHQAERLFRPDPRALATAGRPLRETPAARWMPPELRAVFLALRSPLAPATRALWDRAAAAPYERSYLANVLHRGAASGALAAMGEVLRRFERSHPDPTVPELMDVLAYRAGLYSSGFRWADRYDPRILKAAGRLTGGRDAVARHAQRLTNSLLHGWRNYAGNVMTLQKALDTGTLDCVRGTDLIGALYRGAGYGEYCVLRLTCGTAGHSVGAVPAAGPGRRGLLIVDPLSARSDSRVWPSVWFDGMTWPEGFPGDRGPLFAAELCVRGLDGYVFAEGYVVRGRHAGELVRAALPYKPGRAEAGTRRVFPGPYAPVPAPPSPAVRTMQ